MTAIISFVLDVSRQGNFENLRQATHEPGMQLWQISGCNLESHRVRLETLASLKLLDFSSQNHQGDVMISRSSKQKSNCERLVWSSSIYNKWLCYFCSFTISTDFFFGTWTWNLVFEVDIAADMDVTSKGYYWRETERRIEYQVELWRLQKCWKVNRAGER